MLISMNKFNDLKKDDDNNLVQYGFNIGLLKIITSVGNTAKYFCPDWGVPCLFFWQ